MFNDGVTGLCMIYQTCGNLGEASFVIVTFGVQLLVVAII